LKIGRADSWRGIVAKPEGFGWRKMAGNPNGAQMLSFIRDKLHRFYNAPFAQKADFLYT